MIKAIIFDMDGLMIDSEKVTCDGYAKALTKRGYQPSVEFYKTTLGTNSKTTEKLYKEKYGLDFPFYEVLQEVHKYMADLFETEGVPLKEGLIELLQYLKANNYVTVVATSSARARVDRIFELADVAQYFDDSICGDEVTNSKPDPEIFIKGCLKANANNDEVIVLEDSEAGILASHRANMKVICIPDMKYPESDYANKTYAIVNNLKEVIKLLEE